MAGGGISPVSQVPVTADVVFPNIHIGGGANSKEDEGLGVEASVSPSGIWRLRFKIPEVLPSGDEKLQLFALANATSGVAKVNAKWAMVAPESSPSGATLNTETLGTVTWASGDADVYKELKIDLDAVAVTVSDMLIMDLTFETTDWTLAQISTWYPFLIWE